MRHWLSIPMLRNALWVLAAGVVIPLIFGIVARIFFKRDDDDEKKHPEKALRLREIGAGARPDTPEVDLCNDKPWPSFGPSPKSVPRSKAE